MEILLIDTSCDQPFIAHARDFNFVVKKKCLPCRGASDCIKEFVDSMTETPEVIGIACGPGKFSCLREGAAFAYGLSSILQIPVFGWPSVQGFYFDDSSCREAIALPVSKREAYLFFKETEKGVVLPISRIEEYCIDHAYQFLVAPNKELFLGIKKISIEERKPSIGNILPYLQRISKGQDKNALPGLNYSGPLLF